MSEEGIDGDLARYEAEASVCENYGHAFEGGACVDCGESEDPR